MWKLEFKEVKWLVCAIEPWLDFELMSFPLHQILKNIRLYARTTRDPLCRWFWLRRSEKGYSSHPLGLLEIPTHKQGLDFTAWQTHEHICRGCSQLQWACWKLESGRLSFILPLDQPLGPSADSGERSIFGLPVLSGQLCAARGGTSLDLHYIVEVPELWRTLGEWSSVLREATLNSFSQSWWPQPWLPDSLYTEWCNC